MARPLKEGLDYFPFDVDFFSDIKVRRLSKACGPTSQSILICLLCNIYQDKGYYIEWNKDLPFLIADTVGVSEGSVEEVIKKAVQVELFDENIYEQYKVLTSVGIQSRYILVTDRRKNVELVSEYILIDVSNKKVNVINNRVNVINNRVNVINNPINGDISTQSKVKESKVKEISLSNARESRLVFISLIPLMEELLNDQSCIEDFQRTAGAPYPNAETISDKVKEFFAKLTVDGEETKERKDAIYHFKSWCRQQAEIDRTQKQKGGNNGHSSAKHNRKPANKTGMAGIKD